MPTSLSGRQLGSILNCDHYMLLTPSSGDRITAAEYSGMIGHMLDAQPGVFALRVGSPDAVFYRSSVATSLDKHHIEVCLKTFTTDPGTGEKWLSEDYLKKLHGRVDIALGRLFELGTDPLTLAVDTGHERGVPIVASYRMNSEDLYDFTWMLSDFGREHPDCRIPLTPEEKAGLPASARQKEWTGALDPARPEVYEYRVSIFREVAERYDIDGIEFDFMRTGHMISEPHRHYPILTNMVAETRRMLDKAAEHKGRGKLLLGVRVPPSLATPPDVADYPGMLHSHQNVCCRDKGLDVATWVEKGYVDYVCPSLFWPVWPGKPHTAEFLALAAGTDVGVYPSLFPKPEWLREPIGLDDHERLLRYKNEFCEAALQFHADNPDGISTYNWTPIGQPGMVAFPEELRGEWGLGAKQVQMIMHTKLRDPEAVRSYLEQAAPV